MKFSGFTILQGVEVSIFLLIFEWALQQCSATALPVMNHGVRCIFLISAVSTPQVKECVAEYLQATRWAPWNCSRKAYGQGRGQVQKWDGKSAQLS